MIFTLSVTIDISSGKQLIPEGLIRQVVIASILTWLLNIYLPKCTITESCKHNQNVSSTPSGICYLSQSSYPVFLIPKVSILFGIQAFFPFSLSDEGYSRNVILGTTFHIYVFFGLTHRYSFKTRLPWREQVEFR